MRTCSRSVLVGADDGLVDRRGVRRELRRDLGGLPRRGRTSPTTGPTSRPATTTTSTPGSSTFENPYDDLAGDDGSRNWDSTRRLRELEADGVVAEVIFPNTVPPFFPKSSLVAASRRAPGAGDLERRWAGLRAHNRWLADFCADAPGRRAGICQIMLHDVEGAVAEIRWAAEHGLTGGVLLPGAPPGSGAAAAVRARTTSRSGRCARRSACRSTTTAAARRPTTATTPRPRRCSCSRSRGGPTARSGT